MTWRTLLCPLVLVLGCRTNPAPQKATPSESDASVSAPPATTIAAVPVVKPEGGAIAVDPGADARGLVVAWNRALDGHDAGALQGLYADPVRFYGRSLPKRVVLDAKRKALAGAGAYHQGIEGKISIVVTEKGKAAVAEFEKHSTYAGKVIDVRGRLGMRRDGTGRFLIEEETDDVTPNPCHVDKDCPGGQICMFVVGSTFVCSKPFPEKPCPKGQVFLKSDGACWATCETDADCPEDLMCCPSDPNAPGPICMGSCADP